jgi:hypothetical protein
VNWKKVHGAGTKKHPSEIGRNFTGQAKGRSNELSAREPQ